MVDYYVDTDIGSPGDGTSWAQAKATLSAAVALIPGSIADSYTIHCKGATADATAVTIASKGTTASFTITVQVDSADRHAGVWNASKYHHQGDFGTTGHNITVEETYTRFIGLQLYNTNVGANQQSGIWITVPASGNTQISKCIIRGGRFSVWLDNAGHTVYWWNSVVYGYDATNGGALIMLSGTVNAYSITSGGSAIGQNFRRDGGTLTIKNCYAPGYYSAGTSTIVTSAAGDTSGNPAGLDSIAYSTTNFTNVTASSEDLHLTSGTVLRDAATDTSGEGAPLNFTDDIAGTTRSAWDVGAFEYAASVSARKLVRTFLG